MAERILLIEDDPRLAAMVSDYLGEAGFRVTHAANGTSGLALNQRGQFDAIVLDLMLPDMDGLEVCRRVRAQADTSILMLTARGDAMDRVVGLEMGADDYLPKPFEPRELLALAEHAGRVMSRDALMDLLKGEPLEVFDRSIDVHVSRIRAAIEADPKKPRRVITVRGAGYVFAKAQD